MRGSVWLKNFLASLKAQKDTILDRYGPLGTRHGATLVPVHSRSHWGVSARKSCLTTMGRRWVQWVLCALGVLAILGGCGETRFFASLPIEGSGGMNSPGSGGMVGAGGGSMGMGGGGSPAPRPTLRVEGTRLVSRCGETIVLRGANEMVIWSSERDGVPWFDEMAKLGANSTRIVWLAEGSAEELDRVIQNAIDAGLIPIVEMHRMQFDGTTLEPTDETALDRVVGYFTDEAVMAVLVKHESALIVEFAEALGDLDSVDAWVARYEEAVRRVRAGGFRGPIALDAPFGGARVDELAEGALQVIEADPLSNVMFSVEIWSGTLEEAVDRMTRTRDAGIPFYLGEFSGYFDGICPDEPTDIGPLLARLQELQVGWFAWSWGGVTNQGCDGGLDITINGLISEFSAWGIKVAQTDPNSIARTSVRLESLVGPTCP